VLFPRNNTYNLANLKVSSQNLPQTIEEIRQEWLAVYPEFVFEHEFLDDKIAEFYESEQQLSQLFQAFAGIAVFISCLGLYGLVSFMATQRTKEVGIRKVLGASVSQIVLLFSKEFIRLVCLAFVIATPIAWLIMNQWLQDFEYKISLGANVFLFAGLLTLLIAFLTVSYQSIKAAIANPVKALKSE
jgi:ABC-type antimicrobial peptide transport system permease subunit